MPSYTSSYNHHSGNANYGKYSGSSTLLSSSSASSLKTTYNQSSTKRRLRDFGQNSSSSSLSSGFSAASSSGYSSTRSAYYHHTPALSGGATGNAHYAKLQSRNSVFTKMVDSCTNLLSKFSTFSKKEPSQYNSYYMRTGKSLLLGSISSLDSSSDSTEEF